MPGSQPQIGGLPLVTLHSDSEEGVISAQVAPGRGLMLLGAQCRLGRGPITELVEGPSAGGAGVLLDGGPSDFAGNAAFSFGGAILLPFANRIRGVDIPGRRTIVADLRTGRAELLRNWGGKRPGSAQYAMHGLILDLPITDFDQPDQTRIVGHVTGWDFGGRWPSKVDLTLKWELVGGGLQLSVTATNVGGELLPMGVGWHPYFRVQSQRRGQVRLELPAQGRVRVNNYDEVLPTGCIDPVSGTPYDFSAPGGAALGELYLDDTFVNLKRSKAGVLQVRVLDPAAHSEIRVSSRTPQLRAVQVYAPPERAVVVIEPQFNLSDPFWSGWGPVDTGMVVLRHGQSVNYEVVTQYQALETYGSMVADAP